MEELHKLIPDLDIVWVKDPKYEYELPTWMRPVKWHSWQWLYGLIRYKVD
jgi:CDP-glycerol glycerophosphotransferase